jgi:hypothetical protein
MREQRRWWTGARRCRDREEGAAGVRNADHFLMQSTPAGVIVRGFLAGIAGSLAQTAFFALTKKRAPSPPPRAFEPPEPEQAEESETETLARRFVDKLMMRGPIAHKRLAGQAVHYAFGGAWGAAYAVAAASRRRRPSALAGPGFGLLVWLASDNLLVPSFRLASWPNRYPAKSHAYAMAAHLVYGAVLGGTLRALVRAGQGQLLARSCPRRLATGSA